MAQLLPIHWWKSISPWVVVAWKLGATIMLAIQIDSHKYMETNQLIRDADAVALEGWW